VSDEARLLGFMLLITASGLRVEDFWRPKESMEWKNQRKASFMDKRSKAKRLVWILSLTLGPAVYCILLLTMPGMPNLEAIKKNIIELVFTIIVYWAAGFVFVWIWYWLGKFVLKYGPFL
jgi:hypothetical protein